MLWRRADLERAGGIEALAKEVAEDAASTKIVRAAGRKVRLVAQPFPQPLGHRSASEIWHRQLRWARLRRASFFGCFLPEALSSGLCRLRLQRSRPLSACRGYRPSCCSESLVCGGDASCRDRELAPFAALSSRLFAARSFVAGVVCQRAERRRVRLARQRNAGRAAGAQGMMARMRPRLADVAPRARRRFAPSRADVVTALALSS